jgi:hypothetical protein
LIIQLNAISKLVMTPCGQPTLDRPSGQSRVGHPQGVVVVEAKRGLSKINPIFDTFCLTVFRTEKRTNKRTKKEDRKKKNNKKSAEKRLM